MDSPKSHLMLLVSWAGALVSFLLAHASAALSAGAVLAALVASVYSALASRAKKKFYEKEAANLPDKKP